MGSFNQPFFVPSIARSFFALVVIGMILPQAAQAEIFKWTDDSGATHYTDRPEEVPQKFKNSVEPVSVKPRQMIRTNEQGEPLAVESADSSTPSLPSAPKRQAAYRAGMVSAGGGYYVGVSVNGTGIQPLVLDTGASLTVFSSALARKLGFTDYESGPRIPVSTAGGLSYSYLISLDSVVVGGAVAYDVIAGVSNDLGNITGLLGQTFLNNFVYQVNAANGTLTLTEPDQNPPLHGGKPRQWWLSKFSSLVSEIHQLETMQRDLKRGGRGASVDKARQYVKVVGEGEMEKQIAFYRDQLRKLDRRASTAGTPMSWREYP
jgi:clan AA aspartic protease (TIGR02281 family)